MSLLRKLTVSMVAFLGFLSSTQQLFAAIQSADKNPVVQEASADHGGSGI